MAKKKQKEAELSSYFEAWVRQEQIALWLLGLVLIASSVLAFLASFYAPPLANSIETTIGTVQVPELESLNAMNGVLLWIPALAGVLTLYWTRNRAHVRGLTERLINQNTMMLRILGAIFVFWGIFQFISTGSIVQRLILAPAFIVFGLFSLWRSFKIAGYHAVESED